MEVLSPVFAALGVVEADVLNDLSDWLDGSVTATAAAETSLWPGPACDEAFVEAPRPGGREG